MGLRYIAFIENVYSRAPGGGVLYKVAHKGRLRPKGVSFYERVGILLVKVYEREEEFLISVCKKSQKGLQMHFMPVKKSKKCSCF